MEGVRPIGLSDLPSSKDEGSMSELGGRDLTRDEGREPVEEESVIGFCTTNRRSPSWTGIVIPPWFKIPKALSLAGTDARPSGRKCPSTARRC